MKKTVKEKRGITLVALVITIIVLLILAGITINLTVGQGGILTTAQQAGKNYVASANDEQSQLDDFLQQTESLIALNTDTSSWDGTVNAPQLLTGMTPIKFTGSIAATTGTTDISTIVKTTTASDEEWYDYTNKKWANAQTEDSYSSMWVWIPRFAYKITYYTNSSKTTVSETATQYGSIDVVFLVGTTDYYYKDGGLQKAQRATSDNTAPTTNGDVYTVHPAFTNEKSINYANGGWDSELTGIWVAKFEAGVPDNDNDPTATATGISGWHYPVFQGLKYSYNYISISTAFTLSQAIAKEGNPYGLSSTSTDSHLMKNSEWGAVAYLAQSQYGLNGTNIVINNVSYNGTVQSVKTGTKNVYEVTGYSAGENADEAENMLDTETGLGDKVKGSKTSYAWYTTEGVTASSTGTIYGIYDLSGGAWEYTASYIANGNTNLGNGTALTTAFSSTDTKKYVMLYASNDSGITDDYDKASRANYTEYKKTGNVKIGDAIAETSASSATGTGSNSWNSDYSFFPGYVSPFFVRGGRWNYTSAAGLFAFDRTYGGGYLDIGFRAVLVGK